MQSTQYEYTEGLKYGDNLGHSYNIEFLNVPWNSVVLLDPITSATVFLILLMQKFPYWSSCKQTHCITLLFGIDMPCWVTHMICNDQLLLTLTLLFIWWNTKPIFLYKPHFTSSLVVTSSLKQCFFYACIFSIKLITQVCLVWTHMGLGSVKVCLWHKLRISVVFTWRHFRSASEMRLS